MRTRNPYLAPIMMLATLLCLTVNAYAQGVLEAPHHNVTSPSISGCLDCHDLTAVGWPKFIPEPFPGYVPRDPAVLENENTPFNLKCWECHSGTTVTAGGTPVTLENMATHSSLTMGSTKYGEWAVGCTVCHNAHSQGGQPGGKFIWNFARLDQIEVYGAKAAKSGKKTIIFNGQTGPKSFADGDATYDGICEVCHTETTYHQNNAAGDHTHNAGSNCITCHTHASGFKGGADHSTFINGDTGANGDCIDCHAAVVNDASLHPSCETCHTASPPAINTTPFVGGDTGNSYTALTDDGNYSWNGSSRIQDTSGYTIGDVGLFVPILCSECHDTKPAGLADGTHGGHPATDWDFTAISNDCVDCHSDGGNGTVAGIHNRGDAVTYPSGDCTICHDLGGGDYTVRKVGDATNGIDGDATLVSGRTGDCLTCHPGATYTKTSIHHDTADATATPTNACTSCHNTVNGHAGNHDALVAMQDPNCQVCHAATPASGGDNVPVDGTAGNTVHDYCTSCHVNPSGDIIDTVSIPTSNGWVTTMDNGDGATSTSNGGGTCTECHTAYFDGHEHGTAGPPEHTMSTVALCLNCHTATTIPYLGAGEVHETLACYTCHSTTDGLLIGSANGAGAGANCQTCHIGYFDNHGHSHTFTATADCATCHNLDNTDGSNARDAIAAPFAGTGEVHSASGCYTCHDAGTGALRSLAIGNELAAGCIDCHTDTWTTIHTAALGTVQPAVDHTSLVGFYTACVNCHVVTAADSNARVATDTPFIGAGEVHETAGCLTCHTGASDGGFIAGPFAKADLIKTDGAVCAQCHIATTTWKDRHTGATGLDHTTRVDGLAACVTCHDATAGGPNGLMPVDATAGTKVHDDCYNCHNSTVGLNLGQLLAITATGGSANIAPGDCGTCHGADYFDSHVHGTTGGYVTHDVTYNALVDLSQVSMAGDNPCADCHSGNNADGNGTALDSWTDILSEHVTGCARCHSYIDDGEGTPPQADNDNAIVSGVAVTCATCHTPKIVPLASSDHGGHEASHFGWDGDCQSCHGDGSATEAVVSAIHGDNCDLCHTTGGPYNKDTNTVGDNGDGDATLAEGSADATTPFNSTVYTCTTCHNQTQVPGFHGVTITEVFPSHQLSSDSSGGYDCEECHSTNIGNEQLSTHMPTDSVATCTAVCHGNTTPSATSGIVAKTVIDNVTWAVDPNTNNTRCEDCHAAKGDYRLHGLTDDASVADGIGDGTGGVAFHDNLGNSVGMTVNYSGKLAGAYGGLKVSSYNCGDCHAADPNTKAISALEAMQLHTSTNGTGYGNCLTCHVDAPSVADEIAAGIGATGSVQYCENCHTAANGNGPSGEAMYQYDGVRHHKTAHAQAGDCTYCHADPRPATTTQAGAYAATADTVGTYDTGWIADYSTATPNPIPKQPACRLCHTNYGTDGAGTPWSVDVFGGNGNHGYNIAGYSGTATERTTGLTVYANDFNASLSGAGDNETVTVNATRVTQNTVHRIDANDGSAMIQVYDYGACFGCHSVQVMHAAPVPGADYPALTNSGSVATDVQKVPWDTLRYAPGRAVFNRLRGGNDNNQAWNNHRLRNQNGMQTVWNQNTADPRGRRYIRSAEGGSGWYFGQQITHSAVTVPLHASFSNFDAQAGSVALYFADIAAPAVPDIVRFLSAVWDGATVTVEARNDDGCAALSARTQPDGVQRIGAGGFTGTTTCVGTFAIGSVSGVTLDIETTNAAGTASTGNAITILQAATAADDALGSADSGGPYGLDVLANDTGTDLQVVAIGTVSKTSGAGTCGTITNDTWSIGYTPGGGDAVCSFTYQAQAFVSGSPYGAASQATVTVTQTVNAAPTLSITEPSGQTGQSLSSPVDIAYSLADNDDVVTVSFFLDDDTNPGNGIGSAINCTGGTGAGAEGTNVTCIWDASAIATGGNTYYVYGVADDGVSAPVEAYSGSITFASVAAFDNLQTFSGFGTQNPVTSFGSGTGAGTPDTVTWTLDYPGATNNWSTGAVTASGTWAGPQGGGVDGAGDEFLYTESSSNPPNPDATITSNTIDASIQTLKLSFYYNTALADAGVVIDILESTNGGSSFSVVNTVYTSSSNNDDTWYSSGDWTVSSTSATTQVQIRMTLPGGGSYNDDVSFDNIRIRNTP